MSKHLQLPSSRLVCFGSAKKATMAAEIGEPEVDVGGPEFLA
jgi:hypothetical protein